MAEVIEGPIPEAQHKTMRSRQGRIFVEQAADRLYQAALKCRADRVPWPADLDRCHADLWEHLDWNEELRRAMIGPVGEVDDGSKRA